MRAYDAWAEQLRARRHLVNVTLETTYGCNLNCVHCFNPTHRASPQELTTADAQDLLRQLATQGVLFIALTGGEPLTRPDIFELLACAQRLGLRVTLFTNATLVTPAIADRLRRLELDHVEVSLYGATAAAYEAVTRVPGSFAKFVQGLDLLLAHGVRVRLKTIVVTLNAHEVPAMRAFAQARRLHFEYTSNIQPRADGHRAPLAYRVPPAQAAALWDEHVLQRNPQGTRRRYATGAEDVGCGGADRTALFRCGCGRTSCGISPYGRMNLCAAYHVPQYDLRHGSVAAGWEVLKQYVDGTPTTEQFACPTCPVERACERNVNHAILEMGDPNACVPYHLDLAQRKHAAIARQQTSSPPIARPVDAIST